MDIERLYREHAGVLYRYVARLTGDDEVAADAVQETFVRLVEQDAPPRETRGWLFTVATRWAFERARTQARRVRLLAAEGGALLPSAAPDPAAELEAAERRRIVQEALATLSERDRTVLLMREEGFSHREIAEAVGTTTKSVGTIIARALDRLAAELRPVGDAGGREAP